MLLLPALLLAAPYGGSVVDEATGAPVHGAEVRVVGTTRAASTGPEGDFQIEVPDGFGWLAVEADGYGARETRVGTTVRLWPLDVSEAVADARLDGRPALDSDPIDDPDLTPRARAHLRADRGFDLTVEEAALVAGPRFRPKGALDPPESIRLYRRGDERDDRSCSGRVDVIPLEEYVRGVVPHEWIPSWHQESLNAGAVAARGYAWGWIERGGKYRCADLDDTTRSQVYRDDRDARGDAAVENTRSQGIIRDGVFIPSEYSAENGDPTEFGVDEPLCTGRERRGHGRGMCQWGTQRWATQRDRDYVWMVEHYFPGATVSRPEPPGARISLRQRLARVDPQPCADPGGTFDCADFVPQGRSAGLFDIYLGQRMTITVEVTNEGGAPAEEVVLAVDLPGGLLAGAGVRVDGEAREVDGDALRLDVGPIPAGATRAVGFTLRAAGYSVPTGGPASVRSWVRQVDGLYDKPAWDAPPAVNDGQRFNGGDLRLLTEIDVYDAHHWTWRGGDPELHEGWQAVSDVSDLRAEEGLRFAAAGDTPTIESAYAPIDADRHDRVEVGADGLVLWRAAGETFSPDRSRPLVAGVAELAGAPGWQGAIEQIRIELAGGGPFHLDGVHFLTAANVPPDPDAGPNPPDPDSQVPPVVGRDPPDTGVSVLDAGAGAGEASPDLAGLGGGTSQVRSEGGCQGVPGAYLPWLLCLAVGRRRRA